MSISQKLHEAINEQIKHELYSAYLYLSMSNYCETLSLPGFAHWLRLQWQEETEHAMKFVDHLNDRGAAVTLQGIDQPPAQFGGILELFEGVLEHEEMISGRINDLYELATTEKDYASSTFLQWFITEQVEEEKNANDIIDVLKQIGNDRPALVLQDREMATRQLGAEDA